MMQKFKTNFLALIAIFYIFISSIFLGSNLIKLNYGQSENIKIAGTGSFHLNYNDYRTINLGDNGWVDNVYWSFKSKNSNVSISVFASTELNYYRFIMNSSECQLFELSKDKVENNGRFAFPQANRWYIILLNNDPIKQESEVTYSYRIWFDLWIFWIIPIILNLVVIIFGIIIRIITKKTKIKVNIFGAVCFYLIFILILLNFTLPFIFHR